MAKSKLMATPNPTNIHPALGAHFIARDPCKLYGCTTLGSHPLSPWQCQYSVALFNPYFNSCLRILALKANRQGLKTLSNQWLTNSPPHACVISTLKTAALLLSSWVILLSQGSVSSCLSSLCTCWIHQIWTGDNSIRLHSDQISSAVGKRCRTVEIL